MALKKTITLDGGIVVTDAYHHINQLDWDKFGTEDGGRATIHVAVYANQEASKTGVAAKRFQLKTISPAPLTQAEAYAIALADERLEGATSA